MSSLEIQQAYTVLTESAALVEQERGLVKSLAHREFQHLLEQKDRAKAAGIEGGPVLQSMFFRDMSARKPVFYGFKDPSYDQLISGLAISHNRQYQWLLAEAYELFEDFLVDAYGCGSAMLPDVWSPQDLKAVGNFVGQGVDWWVLQARGLRRPPSAKIILERLRLVPGVRDLEQTNAHEIDFKLALLMVDRMRHVIVHNRGRVENKETFAAAILADAGMLAGGKPKPADAAFIGQYFGDGKLDTTILLLEHPLPPKGPFHMHVDMWGDLLGLMLSYAHMLSQRL